MSVDWTAPADPEKPDGENYEQLVRRLWDVGLSASEIARQIPDATRSSVLGKVHRLKLASRQKATSESAAKLASGSRTPARRTAKVVVSRKSDPPPKSEPKTEFAAGLSLGSRHIVLMQLGEDTCRFPDGDFGDRATTFCGCRPMPGKPYCEVHCARAFEPASNNARRRA